MNKKPNTYKPRQVLRDLESKCEYVKSNDGSHQKFTNPATRLTTVVPIHFGKDMTRHFVKRIFDIQEDSNENLLSCGFYAWRRLL